MATKNLGLVKAIFRQSSSPSRTDVLWYDTVNSILKYYNTSLLSWETVAGESGVQEQVSGSVSVSGTPSAVEISAAAKVSASDAGAGYRFTLNGSGELYQVESDGTDWWYVLMTKAV